MIPTPDLSHLSSKDYEVVYEPAEDTFLLLDALEADADVMKVSNPRVSLEIGSGSGCVSSFLGKILGSSVLYLCTDINSYACRTTFRTGLQNNVILDPLNTAFAFPFQRRLRHNVDIIMLNPPYVPTFQEEAKIAQDRHQLDGSWAGGVDGMDVTNIFLNYVEALLSDKGCFYLVALKQNNIADIRRRMLDIHSLQSEVVLERRAGREYLSVLRFTRVLDLAQDRSAHGDYRLLSRT